MRFVVPVKVLTLMIAIKFRCGNCDHRRLASGDRKRDYSRRRDAPKDARSLTTHELGIWLLETRTNDVT